MPSVIALLEELRCEEDPRPAARTARRLLSPDGSFLLVLKSCALQLFAALPKELFSLP